MKMKIGIIALAIAIVMMVMIPTAMAASMTAMGTIKYENGTTFPYGCYCWMENMEEEYGSEPWDYISEFLPPFFDYQVDGEYVTVDNRFHVWVSSPYGNWFGENTVMYSEVYNSEMGVILVDIIMYEQELTPETFTKSLPIGWNLISLPLTPTDSSTSTVLGNDTIVYDAVKSYNATTHQFEDATTMDPGIGYFVNVTTAGTWEYEGTAYTSMTTSLSQGLNCIGWVNETGSTLPGALSSIDDSYWYVTRWNAGTQGYEVYLPDAPDDVFNDFATMEGGVGYFIAGTGDCTLTYPEL